MFPLFSMRSMIQRALTLAINEPYRITIMQRTANNDMIVMVNIGGQPVPLCKGQISV